MLKNLRFTYHKYRHLLVWKLGHIRSVLNRHKTLELYFEKHRVRKLQVGCGEYQIEGWLNSELYGSNTLFPIDLTKQFPLPDNSFDYIFSEHTHEHFNLEQGMHILQEFHRILRKNGIVRITTPSLKFLIDLYSPTKSTLQKSYIKWSTDTFLPNVGSYNETYVINNFVRAWGHQFIYDYKTLKQQLEKAGFTNITVCKPGISKHKHLMNVEHHGLSAGDDFNKLESMVIEAMKS